MAFGLKLARVIRYVGQQRVHHRIEHEPVNALPGCELDQLLRDGVLARMQRRTDMQDLAGAGERADKRLAVAEIADSNLPRATPREFVGDRGTPDERSNPRAARGKLRNHAPAGLAGGAGHQNRLC